MLVFFAIQGALVLGALLWVGLARYPAGAAGTGWAIARVTSGALLLAGVGLVGLWVYPPRAYLAVAWVAFVVAAAAAWRRAGEGSRGAPPARRWRWLGPAAVAALGAFLVGEGLLARVPPAPVETDLASPLPRGGYVLSGGGTTVMNFHLATLAERYRAFRGQSYGVDLVETDARGWRVTGSPWFAPAPADPAAYRIFGAPLVAPCSGTVVHAEDGHPDRAAGDPDRTAMPGNHVVLACGPFEVLLAHLRRGSVAVTAGDAVATGDELGCAGNSGNSDEPHLHLHVQRPDSAGAPFGSEPVAFTIDGRYLTRNDRLPPTAGR